MYQEVSNTIDCVVPRIPGPRSTDLDQHHHEGHVLTGNGMPQIAAPHVRYPLEVFLWRTVRVVAVLRYEAHCFISHGHVNHRATLGTGL